MAELGPPAEEIVPAHFIVSDDVEHCRRPNTELLGGRVIFSAGTGHFVAAVPSQFMNTPLVDASPYARPPIPQPSVRRVRSLIHSSTKR